MLCCSSSKCTVFCAFCQPVHTGNQGCFARGHAQFSVFLQRSDGTPFTVANWKAFLLNELCDSVARTLVAKLPGSRGFGHFAPEDPRVRPANYASRRVRLCVAIAAKKSRVADSAWHFFVEFDLYADYPKNKQQ